MKNGDVVNGGEVNRTCYIFSSDPNKKLETRYTCRKCTASTITRFKRGEKGISFVKKGTNLKTPILTAKIPKIAKVTNKVAPSRRQHHRQVNADTTTGWVAFVTPKNWRCSTARCRFVSLFFVVLFRINALAKWSK